MLGDDHERRAERKKQQAGTTLMTLAPKEARGTTAEGGRPGEEEKGIGARREKRITLDETFNCSGRNAPQTYARVLPSAGVTVWAGLTERAN